MCSRRTQVAAIHRVLNFCLYFSSVRTEKSAPPFGLLLFFFYLLFVFFSFFFITSLVTTSFVINKIYHPKLHDIRGHILHKSFQDSDIINPFILPSSDTSPIVDNPPLNINNVWSQLHNRFPQGDQ